MFVTVTHRKRTFAVVAKRMQTFKKLPKLPFELVEYILVLTANLAVTSAGGRGSQIECFEALCAAYPRHVSEKTFDKYEIWVPSPRRCSSCGYSYSGSYGVAQDWSWCYDDDTPLETPMGWLQRHADDEKRSDRTPNRPRRFRRPRYKRRKNKDRAMRDAQ